MIVRTQIDRVCSQSYVNNCSKNKHRVILLEKSVSTFYHILSFDVHLFQEGSYLKIGFWKNQERCHSTIAVAINVESTLYLRLFFNFNLDV